MRIWCTGLGKQGQLGHGKFRNESLPIEIFLHGHGQQQLQQPQQSFPDIQGKLDDVFQDQERQQQQHQQQQQQHQQQQQQQQEEATVEEEEEETHFQIRKIAVGNSHCLALHKHGEVLSWGEGSNYKLGHGDTCDQSVPKRIESFLKSGIRIVDIACGEQHSMAVDDQGNLYCWGVGREGQLGIGRARHKLKYPTKLPQGPFDGRKIVRIASNSCFSFVLTEDGRVYSFGWGAHGRLGHGDDNQRVFPCMIQTLEMEHIVDVACGWRHTLLLNDQGELFSVGRNSNGQLGHQDYISRNTPMKIDCFGAAPLETVVKIACGERFSMALTASGKVYCWGDGMYGQLGYDQFNMDNATMPIALEDLNLEAGHIVDIACGSKHAVAVSKSGDVYSWGRGVDGQLGHSVGSGQDAVRFPYKIDFRAPIHIGRIFCGGATTFFISKHAPLVDIDSPDMFERYRLLFSETVANRSVDHVTAIHSMLESIHAPLPDVSETNTMVTFHSRQSWPVHINLLCARSILIRRAHRSLWQQRRQQEQQQQQQQEQQSTDQYELCWEEAHENVNVKMRQQICSSDGPIRRSEWYIDISLHDSSQQQDQLDLYHHGILLVLEFIYCGCIRIEHTLLPIVLSLSRIFAIPALEQQCRISMLASTNDHMVGDLDQEEGCRKATLRDMVSLQRDLAYLMNDHMTSDTILRVVDQNGNSIGRLLAHRVILCVGSDHFRSMFHSCMQETTSNTVDIELETTENQNDEEIKLLFRTFKRMVEYIYTSNVRVEETICFPLLRLADQFGLSRLKQMCEMRIATLVQDRDSAAAVFEIAQDFNALQLRRVCQYYLSDTQTADDSPELVNLLNPDVVEHDIIEHSSSIHKQGPSSILDDARPDIDADNLTVAITEDQTVTRRGILLSRRLQSHLTLQNRLDILRRKKWSHDSWLSFFRSIRKIAMYVGIILLFLPVTFFIVIQGLGQWLSDIWFERHSRIEGAKPIEVSTGTNSKRRLLTRREHPT